MKSVDDDPGEERTAANRRPSTGKAVNKGTKKRRLPEIRAAFGNPFFYSRPAEPDEGKANYTGHRSHDVGLPTLLDLIDVEREIARLKSELSALGS